MTTAEKIRRVRSAWREISGGFHKKTTTTSAGSDTTFVSTNITAVDDFLNQKELVIGSGNASGQRQLITDWVFSTKVGTLEASVGFTIASGVTIEVGENGFWSDREILDWLNDGQDDMASELSDEVLFKALTVTANLSLSSGVATLPADFDRPANEHVLIDSAVAPILGRGEHARLLTDQFLVKKAMYRNGALLYRPTSASIVELEYVKTRTAIDIDNASPLEAKMHQALCDYAIYRGWLKGQKEELADRYLGIYRKKIEGYNRQWQGRI